MVAVLAQVADMERQRIVERTAAGRATAREHLERSGKTHRGKLSLGRPFQKDPRMVATWRRNSSASIAKTATHFDLSQSTVKRYCSLDAAREVAHAQAAISGLRARSEAAKAAGAHAQVKGE
jgi:putative DNA-invertase from lambdoid prophage Rac